MGARRVGELQEPAGPGVGPPGVWAGVTEKALGFVRAGSGERGIKPRNPGRGRGVPVVQKRVAPRPCSASSPTPGAEPCGALVPTTPRTRRRGRRPMGVPARARSSSDLFPLSHPGTDDPRKRSAIGPGVEGGRPPGDRTSGVLTSPSPKRPYFCLRHPLPFRLYPRPIWILEPPKGQDGVPLGSQTPV